MADGNFLTAIGVDPQLVTAGGAGGLVKALITKQKVLDAMASITVGALVANYAGKPSVDILASLEVAGMHLTLRPEVGAFFTGIFAFWIVATIGTKLRAKFGKDDGAPP